MKSELSKLPMMPINKFPALYEKSGVVVLFEDEDIGTVVVGNTYFTLGSTLAFDVNDWQRLPSGSQVILTQD